MIKAFVVDDEEHALNILELFLQRTGEVEVIGRSSNGFDAIRKLKMLRPDVLFLDIEMPEMNGLELAEIVRNDNNDVQIVFVTAYDQYAISAFEHAAIDYILKPLEMDRLAKTIARIQKENARSGIVAEHAALVNEAPDAPMLTIRLFGQYFAGIDDGPRMKWRTSKEKELMAYLAVQEDSRVHRDLIIENLWPEDSFHKAKVYLHTCISLLRKNMKQLGFDGVLKYENERYYLDPERVEIDVRIFREHLNRLKKLESPDCAEIEQALLLYEGPLLKDEDYVWAEQEMEQYDKSASQWRSTLTEAYIKLREYDKAVTMAELTIDHSPYEEGAYRLLMKGYHCLGRNDQVLSVYRRLAHKLEELQIKPSEMTTKLYEEMIK
ncbi:response regulator [Cohnella herbarum]|uniref:Response regulator n=1 Tax=Cohnella herbarum TaxID=2728023 RepID=A0A7Z2ZLQ2_9BACL|nr:response regulator [Cohnella herbarum]QJD84546.1 response regulator [Cohnella herbarum]